MFFCCFAIVRIKMHWFYQVKKSKMLTWTPHGAIKYGKCIGGRIFPILGPRGCGLLISPAIYISFVCNLCAGIKSLCCIMLNKVSCADIFSRKMRAFCIFMGFLNNGAGVVKHGILIFGNLVFYYITCKNSPLLQIFALFFCRYKFLCLLSD